MGERSRPLPRPGSWEFRQGALRGLLVEIGIVVGALVAALALAGLAALLV
jgi:hypothetical protein